jgi:hypothetical protein
VFGTVTTGGGVDTFELLLFGVATTDGGVDVFELLFFGTVDGGVGGEAVVVLPPLT